MLACCVMIGVDIYFWMFMTKCFQSSGWDTPKMFTNNTNINDWDAQYWRNLNKYLQRVKRCRNGLVKMMLPTVIAFIAQITSFQFLSLCAILMMLDTSNQPFQQTVSGAVPHYTEASTGTLLLSASFSLQPPPAPPTTDAALNCTIINRCSALSSLSSTLLGTICILSSEDTPWSRYEATSLIPFKSKGHNVWNLISLMNHLHLPLISERNLIGRGCHHVSNCITILKLYFIYCAKKFSLFAEWVVKKNVGLLQQTVQTDSQIWVQRSQRNSDVQSVCSWFWEEMSFCFSLHVDSLVVCAGAICWIWTVGCNDDGLSVWPVFWSVSCNHQFLPQCHTHAHHHHHHHPWTLSLDQLRKGLNWTWLGLGLWQKCLICVSQLLYGFCFFIMSSFFSWWIHIC